MWRHTRLVAYMGTGRGSRVFFDLRKGEGVIVNTFCHYSHPSVINNTFKSWEVCTWYTFYQIRPLAPFYFAPLNSCHHWTTNAYFWQNRKWSFIEIATSLPTSHAANQAERLTFKIWRKNWRKFLHLNIKIFRKCFNKK